MSSSKISDQSESWCSGQNRTVAIGRQVLNEKVTIVSVTKKKKNKINPHSRITVVSERASSFGKPPVLSWGGNHGWAASGTFSSTAEAAGSKQSPAEPQLEMCCWGREQRGGS